MNVTLRLAASVLLAALAIALVTSGAALAREAFCMECEAPQARGDTSNHHPWCRYYRPRTAPAPAPSPEELERERREAAEREAARLREEAAREVARGEVALRQGPDGMWDAEEAFRRANAIAPSAPAYGGLAECHLFFAGFQGADTATLHEQARAACEKGLELDPQDPRCRRLLTHTLNHIAISLWNA